MAFAVHDGCEPRKVSERMVATRKLRSVDVAMAHLTLAHPNRLPSDTAAVLLQQDAVSAAEATTSTCILQWQF